MIHERRAGRNITSGSFRGAACLTRFRASSRRKENREFRKAGSKAAPLQKPPRAHFIPLSQERVHRSRLHPGRLALQLVDSLNGGIHLGLGQ